MDGSVLLLSEATSLHTFLYLTFLWLFTVYKMLPNPGLISDHKTLLNKWVRNYCHFTDEKMKVKGCCLWY